MKSVSGLAVFLLPCVLIVANAEAVPIVSVDTDPTTPGIQSALNVLLGNPFMVDVVIEGIEASLRLNAFQFDLLFDPAVLSATDIVSGGFLPTIDVFEVIGLSVVSYAEASLGGSAIGSGVLASVSFDTLAVGTSTLDLTNVILAALVPPGAAIEAAVNDGSVTVTSEQSIPEPGTLFLLCMGIAGLVAASRRR